MKILFQGDSITDAYRDRSNPHDLGPGYPKFAAELIRNAYKDTEFEFLNLGIGGDQTRHLVERLESDFIEIQPDIVSILIGINDTWQNVRKNENIPADVTKERYRIVLSALKERTHAKIMIMEPFLIPIESRKEFREDLDAKINVIRALACEFADVYMPTDGLFAAAYIGDDPQSFAADGIHPTQKGAEFIARQYADYISPLIDSLK